MTKATLRRVVLITLITGVVSSYQACGPAGTSANQTSSQSMKSGYGGGSAPSGNRGGTTTDNPKVTVNLMIASYSSENVMGAELCVKDIKFDSQEDAQIQPTSPNGSMKVQSITRYRYNSSSSSSSSSGSASSSGYTSWDMLTEYAQLANSIGSIFGGSGSTGAGLGGISEYLEEFQEELDQWYSYVPTQSSYNALPSGTQMDKFEVPSNEYSLVEVNLEPTCVKGSLSVNKPGGSISSKKPLKMRFKGKVKLSSSGDVKLDMQKIIDALSTAKSGDDFQNILNQTTGDLL